MKAILTDTTKCVGCRECVVACKKRHDLENAVPRRWNSDDGLSARNWTSIVEKPEKKYIRKQCRHCLEPACVSACPVGALRKNKDGAVVYDGDKCMGCRYCMMACPYGIPRYDWDQQIPYVRKCILCAEHVAKGEEPACTETCPTQATIFGDRDELLAEARRRIKGNPNKYIDRIWGEHEIGGSQVLYISDTDLSCLSYGQHLGDKPLPERTSTAMKAVPFAFVGMGSVMAGVSWVIGRRMENQRRKNDQEGTDNE
ncbi:MAG: 4Fe-4S dicluster domain-containing protein [Calditrichaeota bacterium]|jgi:formate dehydrogenase iron-sulfur subunit|nr:4Fe-4S dicluster domain-containing protein [Calditrichota bacterium]MBT7616581.1 4Fe-4S dicluster domain-containing protein [Calditrichota bacterium]MBT7787615.1 4Fe-4S dicluster domain-containing protein [Calditrichota bacterium]